MYVKPHNQALVLTLRRRFFLNIDQPYFKSRGQCIAVSDSDAADVPHSIVASWL